MTGHDDYDGSGDHDDGVSTESDALLQRLYRMHGPTLERIRVLASSDAGTTEGRDESGGRPVTAVFTSLVDAAVSVRVVATNIPLEQLTQFTGRYPHRSRLMIVTVAAQHIENGKVADLERAETDAWASALAPADAAPFIVRLGVMTGSTRRAVHYRYILGPDRYICVIDDDDHERLRGGW